MNLLNTTTSKRQRDEEDAIYASGLLTPEGSVGQNFTTEKPTSKKFRAECAQDEDDSERLENSDDTMVDVVRSPRPSSSHLEMIARLDVDALRDIVNILAARSTDAQALVEIVYSRLIQEVDLRRYAAEVDRVFSSRSDRYSIAGAAYSDVKSSLDALARQVGPQSSYDAKKSAVEALQDIAFSILRADRSRQAVEVRAQFEKDDCIPRLMLQIVQSMSEEERARISEEATVHGSTFAKGLQWAHEKAVEDYVAGFYDFSLVLESLSRNTGG